MSNDQFFQRTALPSGITVITERMTQVRSVAIGFWVGVGSRDETEPINGMSHFIEHLLFKGTKTRTAREISEAFDTLGGELNAFTAKEYTCYYSRLLDEHVSEGTEILADMIQNPKFAEDDINSERNVILEEINLHEDSPDERIHDLFATSLWTEHPLGKSILGHLETIKNVSRDDALGFYHQEYVPNNLIVAAAGNIDHNKMVELTRQHFNFAPGKKPARKEFTPRVEKKIDVFTKKTEQSHIVLGAEAIHAKDERRFTLSILDNILGGSMSSRLFQEIREKRGLAYSTYSYHSLYQDAGFIASYAGTAPENTEAVVKLIQEQLQDILNGGITDQELYRSKEHLKGQLVLGLESTGRRMTRLGKLAIIGGEILSLDELVERIEAVTKDGVTELAQQLFNPEKMVLTIIGPFELENLAHLVV
ncbi:pitrilysin family protein [Candidatus Aquicultor secundus]|uniref:Peptidase M16 n=1 Tax=Candidatus Aquicultor secundus TaxID=1973895 RepID=A0A2M7T7D6_9ACTN|nr:pitrilysin family protein [Candidatus Aquicultor secundus]PIZ37802.1 MAG: peptidase M16 [Candidatus Aquicultor secundus]